MMTSNNKITLYQFQLCPFCHKVRAALELKGVPYTKVEVAPGNKKELPPLPEEAPRKVPVLQVNDEIGADRRRLLDLHTRARNGKYLPAVDRLWLIVLAERYKVKRGDLKRLLKRVDIMPTSMALAQAAEESGWGTSRFSREGNAIFGEWTFSGSEGLVPLEREAGKTHKVRAFRSLLDSVRSYARNLNTHRAYRKLRTLRQRMRRDGTPIRGRRLIETLTSYSERGMDYVKDLRAIMSVNKLDGLDAAKLSQPETAEQPFI